MHPLLADRRALRLYLAGWLPLGLLLAGGFALARPGAWAESLAVALPLALLFAFVCLSAWYVARALPLAEIPPARLAAALGLSATLASLLWLAAGTAWSALLQQVPGCERAAERFSGGLADFFVAGVLLYLLALAGHYLALAAARSRAAERQALEAMVLARDAELRSLRAQLDPHFLFNALNSVSALVGTDPAAARRMCLLLAGFFRKSLGLAQRESISLAEELYLAETYLAIEQVRFGARLRVASEIAEEALTLAVPPLLLQPLVENAVHHGIAHRLDGGEVRLTARRAGERLELEVENPCDADRPASHGTGVGLANVRARAERATRGAARVEVTAEPERFRVRLSLPAQPAPGPT